MYVNITGLQKLTKPLLFAYIVYILTHYSVKHLNVKDKQSISMNPTVRDQLVTTASKSARRNVAPRFARGPPLKNEPARASLPFLVCWLQGRLQG